MFVPDIAVEEIPSADHVSRYIDSPHKFSPQERELIAPNVFQLPSSDGQRESLVWRKYKPAIEDVHALGCAIQWVKRAANPNWTYEGAISAKVECIRQIKSKLGGGFSVEHAPAEGIHHAEVKYRVADGRKLGTAEKLDLKQMLRDVFSPMESHVCKKPFGH